MENVDYEEYNYTESAYQELLKGYEVIENESIWNKVSVGNITVNY